MRRELLTHGVRPPLVRYRETIERAVAEIKGTDIKGADTPPDAAPEGLAAS